MGVRDHWDKDDGDLKKSIKDLKELLGHDVVVEPEWQLLLAELDKFYPDKGNFVATVARCVETWCKSLSELLEDEANEEWTDNLLERLKSWSRLRLCIEVSPPSVTWRAARGLTIYYTRLPAPTSPRRHGLRSVRHSC